jgi:integrase/recombinase XerD
MLDPSCTPGERATDERLSDFLTELRARVAPVSAAMMLGALVRMLSALEPDRDWGPLARVYNHLRQTAAPSRDKLSRLVRASDLFELGLRLMDTCEDGPDRPVYVATRYRDGLIIALLIACPMRIKNLANLVIGQHFVFDGRSYGVKLSAAETKTGRPYVATVPPELTPTSMAGFRSTAKQSKRLERERATWAVSGATFGSIATVGRCAAPRSGIRSNHAPAKPSARRSGHTYSGTAR